MSTSEGATSVRVADWIMNALYELGVRHAFMVAGGGAMHLNDAIGAHGKIEVVCALHEQGAAIAAEAYGKQAGGPALCLVTAGPGGTNAITGVTAAWLDSVPMIVVSGQVKRPDLVGSSGVRQRGVQEVDIVSMVRPVTKFAEIIMDPADVRFQLERAFHLATSGRPGPVWLDVPLDVQGAHVNPESLRGFDASAADDGLPISDHTPVIRRYLDVLQSARRPLILVGAGVRLAHAQDDVVELAESLGMPVLTTWPAQGVLGDDHPLCVGRPGTLASRGANFALQNADVLLCLGARLDLVTTGYDPKDFARSASKIVIDIDANELAKLVGAVEITHQSDVGAFVRALLAEIQQSDMPVWVDDDQWAVRCQSWKRKYPVVTEEHRQPGSVVSTYHLADVISDTVTEDDVLALCCSGLGIEIFILALRLHTGQQAIFNNALGAMGCGPPTALGACLASGRRRTICVDGDGGLQLNVQELETIQRLNLPVKLFVLANDGYASIRASQNRWFGRLVGADSSSGLSLPPLDRIAAAYGWTYATLAGEDPLGPQVKQVLDLPGPVLCEVPSPRDEPRVPVQTSVAQPDGGMRSLPLEDLAPRLEPGEFSQNMVSSDGRFPSPPWE